MQKAAAKQAGIGSEGMTDDERRKLVSTQQSLGTDDTEQDTYTLSRDHEDKPDRRDVRDAESFFNIPKRDDDDDK